MATNFATATYTEIIDLQTTNGQTSIIGIHTPIGLRPYHRLKGFFTNFKKFKYLGIKKCTIVPAAGLPVDPLGITSIPGTTQQMDPRDLLNPIISHGCHGESLSKVLNTIYRPDNIVGSGSATTTTDLGIGENTNASDSLISTDVYNSDTISYNVNDAYYNCLTDRSWKKHNIQSGLRLSNLYPLVHNMVSNYPIVPSFPIFSNEGKNNISSSYDPISVQGGSSNNIGFKYPFDGMTDYGGDGIIHSAPIYPTMFTSGVRRLGWMPTFSIKFDGNNNDPKNSRIATMAPVTLPKLFMHLLVLPPSYQVEQYFRCVLVHKFAFKDFTTSLGFESYSGILNDHDYDALASTPSYFNWIDYSETSTATDDDISSGSVSAINEGTTIDGINASTSFVADGVA